MTPTPDSHLGAWVVVGSPTQDAYISCEDIVFEDHWVRFLQGGPRDIAYLGEPMVWGAKRTAVCNLTAFRDVPGVSLENGGGVRNTATELARKTRKMGDARLCAEVVAVDLSSSWPELDSEYRGLGVRHVTLAKEDVPLNVIPSSPSSGDRVILKSPVEPAALDPEDVSHLNRQLGDGVAVVLINSPKSRDLASAAVALARSTGALQYSVLSPSLPLEDRVELLLGNDVVSVCNLAEFSAVAMDAGIECPTDEVTAPMSEIAKAMCEVARKHKTGDLAITIGARGSVAAEADSGKVYQVVLRKRVRERVQECIHSRLGLVNGIGDRYFANFVRQHVLLGAGKKVRYPVGEASLQASIDVVRDLAPTVRITRSSFLVRVLSHAFARRRSEITSAGVASAHLSRHSECDAVVAHDAGSRFPTEVGAH